MKSVAVFLKELRLKHQDERLSDMAKKLGVSASYLSTVETEKRRMNDRLYDNIIQTYELDEQQAKELDQVRNFAAKKLNIPLEDVGDEKKEMMVKFLSNIDTLDEEDLKKIDLIIKSKEK